MCQFVELEQYLVVLKYQMVMIDLALLVLVIHPRIQIILLALE